MDGHLRIDRDILIAGITSAISIIGICLVFTLGLRQNSQPVAVPEPTATAFKYAFLATETQTAEPETGEVPEILLERQASVEAAPVTQELNVPETAVFSETDIATDSTAVSDTQPVDESQLMVIGKYDDTDLLIIYYGDWSSEFFEEDAFEETLSISTVPGNTATFSFMGRQLVLGYLGAPDFELGMLTVAIDGDPHQVDQEVGDNWTSPQLIFDQHEVILTHQTGDLIYLDYVEIR